MVGWVLDAGEIGDDPDGVDLRRVACGSTTLLVVGMQLGAGSSPWQPRQTIHSHCFIDFAGILAFGSKASDGKA